jgi:hypothetical protein
MACVGLFDSPPDWPAARSIPMSDSEFVVSFPSWIIVAADSIAAHETGKLARLKPKAKVYFLQVEGQSCLPIFTDNDLANRHIRENKIEGSVLLALRDGKHLLENLVWLRTQGTVFVGFDPPPRPGQFRYHEIGKLISELEYKT